MNINALLSRWITAADLPQGKTLRLTMRRVTVEEVYSQKAKGLVKKPVLWFLEARKGLIINRTNADAISAMYGPEVDNWPGQPVGVQQDTTRVGNKTVPCVRIVPAPGGAPAVALREEEEEEDEAEVDAAPEQEAEDW